MNGSLNLKKHLMTSISSSEILDNTLKSINSDYEAKRHKDINLVNPVS